MDAKQKQLKFLKKSFRISTNDILGLFATTTFGLHLITLIILFLLYGAYSRLSKKPPPTLVELQNGDSVKVAPIDNQERTPQAIIHFVSSTFTLMMNWSGTIPDINSNSGTTKPKPDPGVNIGSGRGEEGKVSFVAWEASYTLSSDFRKEFLELLSQMTPSGVFQQKTQVVFVPLSIQQPIQISPGKWKVKMVSNLNVFDTRSNIGEVIPFNKEIFVRAVEAPKKSPTKGLSSLIYHIRESGLEIYAIRDLKEENL